MVWVRRGTDKQIKWNSVYELAWASNPNLAKRWLLPKTHLFTLQISIPKICKNDVDWARLDSTTTKHRLISWSYALFANWYRILNLIAKFHYLYVSISSPCFLYQWNVFSSSFARTMTGLISIVYKHSIVSEINSIRLPSSSLVTLNYHLLSPQRSSCAVSSANLILSALEHTQFVIWTRNEQLTIIRLSVAYHWLVGRDLFDDVWPWSCCVGCRVDWMQFNLWSADCAVCGLPLFFLHNWLS